MFLYVSCGSLSNQFLYQRLKLYDLFFQLDISRVVEDQSFDRTFFQLRQFFFQRINLIFDLLQSFHGFIIVIAYKSQNSLFVTLDLFLHFPLHLSLLLNVILNSIDCIQVGLVESNEFNLLKIILVFLQMNRFADLAEGEGACFQIEEFLHSGQNLLMGLSGWKWHLWLKFIIIIQILSFQPLQSAKPYIQNLMQVVFGLIYFFTVFLVFCTLALSVFLIPKVRQWLVQVWNTYKHIFKTDIVRYSQLLIFGMIALVLIQSILTFTALNAHFSNKSLKLSKRLGGLQNMDLIIQQSENRQGYMMALKEYREFYMAERNIMLAVSALFIFFVFQRIFYNIRKYSETEAQVAKLKSSV